MNKLIQNIFFLLIINIVFSSALRGETMQVSGQYFHKPTGKILYIEIVENGLMLKDKMTSTWRYFPKIGRGLFMDKRGNRVEIRNRNEIIFVPRRSTRGLVYKKVNQNFDQIKEEDDYITKNTNAVNPNSLEGLWFDKVSQVYLIVVETREGIKVRLKDERKWYAYPQGNYANIYISADNHKYEFLNGKLIYNHFGATGLMTFDKISDTFDGY